MVLNRRIRDYLNERFLLIQIKKTNSYIYNSLLKYGYSNFILEILEHSDPNDILKREQYYLNQMNPEYNILKIAGSLKGFKHSLETKRNLSIINRGKTISELHKKKLHFNIKAHFIEIKDIKTNKIILFFSIRKAALYLKVHHSYIAKNLTKKGFCLTKGYYIYRSL
jgi:group I intron endonuclease